MKDDDALVLLIDDDKEMVDSDIDPTKRLKRMAR